MKDLSTISTSQLRGKIEDTGWLIARHCEVIQEHENSLMQKQFELLALRAELATRPKES